MKTSTFIINTDILIERERERKIANSIQSVIITTDNKLYIFLLLYSDKYIYIVCIRFYITYHSYIIRTSLLQRLSYRNISSKRRLQTDIDNCHT
jgi:hypothetical protein